MLKLIVKRDHKGEQFIDVLDWLVPIAGASGVLSVFVAAFLA